RDKKITKDFYANQLGFKEYGNTEYDGHLMMECDRIQIHFFEFKELEPKENYGQVYIRTDNIEKLYESLTHNGHPFIRMELENKPWGQRKFSVLDPDNNQLTFGQNIYNNQKIEI